MSFGSVNALDLIRYGTRDDNEGLESVEQMCVYILVQNLQILSTTIIR